jgi:branched-chain amino acid transport system permease protein
MRGGVSYGLALECGAVLVTPSSASTGVSLRRALRITGLVLLALVIAFPIVWVLFIASNTTFGPAIDDPKNFLITLLNGVTAAALYFIVASGFTLIFGLMRVVNMAHGAFFLLGGYIALELQRNSVSGGDSALGISSAQVGFMNWFLPLMAAGLIVGGVGLLMQQAFLRWNQGQELRQALITIAVSIIAADQMLAHFGGVAKDISWPRTFDKFVNLQVAGVEYTLTRIVILGVGLFIGGALWFWLKRTRTGMVIRAGVDDRDMVSALGVNIQLTFAIAFFIGSALAGIGGAMGGSFASLAPGVDGLWLLNSLVVVIIGGMGSLGGAAIGALLLGLTTNFAAAYLPSDYTFYSIIFTFVLLAVVLAARPLGLFGRPA